MAFLGVVQKSKFCAGSVKRPGKEESAVELKNKGSGHPAAVSACVTIWRVSVKAVPDSGQMFPKNQSSLYA